MAILECFTPANPVRRVTDIAHELGMHPATTHRYLVSLNALGFVQQVSRRMYRLTVAVTRLGLQTVSAIGVPEHAERILEDLARRTLYNSSIAVLDGSEVLVLQSVPGYLKGGRLPLSSHLQGGSHLPSYCTALGKVLLAGLSIEERDEILMHTKLTPRNSRTITSLPTLQVQMDEAKEDGFAVEEEELASGILAIAAPVLDDAADVIAAVSLTATTDRIGMVQFCDDLTPRLLAAADEISARMGYRREDEP